MPIRFGSGHWRAFELAGRSGSNTGPLLGMILLAGSPPAAWQIVRLRNLPVFANRLLLACQSAFCGFVPQTKGVTGHLGFLDGSAGAGEGAP